MRHLIYGAGAIGSGIGGHLHRTGYEVVLVGRPGHVDAIRERGLALVILAQTSRAGKSVGGNAWLRLGAAPWRDV